MQEKEEEWPCIELTEPKFGILSQFTSSASEAVSHILVKELVEKVDKQLLTSSSQNEDFSTDQDLEWIMQVINHSLTLHFIPNQCYETLRSAVRIYIAWSAALTTDSPKQFCPKQILLYPDKYFKKFLEAFRHIFQEKESLSTSDNHLVLSRQGTQIQTILTAIRHLTNNSKDEFKDEVWARCLLFLLNINDQLITIGSCKSQESIGYLMARDLCQNLFDCWIKASLNECIPSPAYWSTFSSLSLRCGAQIQFIECWATSLLHSSSLLFQHLFGQQFNNGQENVLFDDDNAFGQFSSTLISSPERISILKNVWLNLFILLGRPTKYIENALSLLATTSCKLSTNSIEFFTEQIKLSFFLIVFTFKKLVDLFFGENNIFLDFNESEELHSQWLEAALVNNNRSNILTKQEQRFPSSSDGQMFISSSTTTTSNNTNSEMTAVQISGQVLAQQHVWFILKNHPFDNTNLLLKRRSSSSMLLNLFLDWLFEAALFRISNENNLTNDSTKGDCDQPLVLSSSLNPPVSNKSLSSVADSCTTTTNNSIGSIKSNNVSTFSSKRPSVPINFQQQIQSGINNTTTTTTTLRRSFATSISRSSTTQSSSMLSSSGGDSHNNQQQHLTTNYSSPTEFPCVDGISSGRAAALSALCKIICTKHTNEQLRDDQLARFFALAHEALISNDRIVLSSFIFSTADNLFKLALKGIQILLPNYLRAIELLHNESLQILLHPSISQIEMRAACLRALSSVLAWPSVFGWANIISGKASSSPSQPFNQNIKRQGSFSSSSNFLETFSQYADLREPIQRILICSLRQETDPFNVQFSLGIAAIFCLESAEPELKRAAMLQTLKKENKKMEEGEITIDGVDAPFSTSLVRSFVSAICDNLCKPAWANETSCCLAAFDCLNSLCSLPRSVLFSNGELSTGSLIVTSLCRFIEQQLKKPPPLHSKDMHSTVVAAYFCMSIWLCSEPCLARIESCLETVALAIELGMTGGLKLTPENYKPASQRVHDAAQALLHSLFSTKIPLQKTETQLNFLTKKSDSSSINELILVQKFGLKLDKFQHFLLQQQNTLISLYEAQHIPTLSKGLPCVIAVFRTPFNAPWANLFRLMPRAPPSIYKSPNNNVNNNQINLLKQQQQATNNNCENSNFNKLNNNEQIINKQNNSSNILSIQTKNNNNCTIEGEGGGGVSSSVASNSSGVSSAPTTNITKQFKIPKECFEPECEFDKKFPKLEPIPPQVEALKSQFKQIQDRLASGNGAPIGDRDTRNIWLNNSLGALLTKPPIPESPVSHCNSLRVFLYDLGLINRTSYLNELLPLDSSSFDIFYDSLYKTVDQHPVLLTEKVFLFYVKEGQKTVEDILQNNIDLRQTNCEYCHLLSELGKAFETRERICKNGNNFSIKNDKKESCAADYFVFDGIDYCLNWRDSHVNIYFITPTGRMTGGIEGNKASSVRRTATLRPSSVEMPQQQCSQNTNNINIINNIENNCKDLQFYNKNKNNFNEYYNNQPSLTDSFINENKCEENKSVVFDIKRDEKNSYTTSSDEYEFFKNRAMFIWAQSIDEINAMERDLIGSETEHQLKEEETLIADGKCSFNVLSSTSSAISMPIPSSSTPPSLPARSARFSTCTSPLSFEKQRRLSLISSTRNSSQGSADSNGSICCKRIDLIKVFECFLFLKSFLKSEDDEIMGGEQHIRVSSNSATFSSPVIKHAAAHRRTSIQSARLRRHNLKKIDINYNNDINNTISPPQSPPPMSHGRRTSTVFREILLGNLRVEDVTFPDKASSTAAATVGSSLPDCDSNTSFNQLETSSLASTSTVSNCVTKLSASIKPQKIIKPPLQRNDSIASTSTTTSTFSFFKSLFSRRTTRTSQQNSQASSECGMSGRRKSSLAKVIDEEQEDLDGGEERERICNQSIIKEKLINEKGKNKLEEENVPMEPFVSSNGNNNTRIKDGIVSPSNLPASSISSTRTMSSTSVGNESSAHSTTATTTTTNIEQQQSTKQKSSKRSSDLRIFIVWLERLEDMATFPFAEMFPFTTSINDYNCKNLTSMNSTNQQPTTTTIDHLIFYIFPFEKGLRRIQIDGIWTKQGKPGPLHNGTVVSSRALPSLLRQTICNISRRKAVEIDNYQMTHLKRKQAIAEFGRRFATRLDYTEFVEQLLKNNSSFFGTVFPP